MTVEESPLILERNAGSNLVRAQWTSDKEQYEVMIPARTAEGEVCPHGCGSNLRSNFSS